WPGRRRAICVPATGSRRASRASARWCTPSSAPRPKPSPDARVTPGCVRPSPAGPRSSASEARRIRPAWGAARGVALNTKAWHHGGMDATLVLGQQGRLVIPADVRAALGLAPGDRLHLHLAGPRLILERPQDAV